MLALELKVCYVVGFSVCTPIDVYIGLVYEL